jgi:hypothetical protein
MNNSDYSWIGNKIINLLFKLNSLYSTKDTINSGITASTNNKITQIK